MKKIKLGKALCAYVLAVSFLFSGFAVSATELEPANNDVYLIDEGYLYDSTEAVYDYDTTEYVSITPLSQGWYSVPITNVRQMQSLWCWAASAVAALRQTDNVIVAQGAFVTRVHGSQVNRPANAWQTLTGIWHWNGNRGGTDGVGAGVAMRELRAGRPLLAGTVDNHNSNLGHMVVVAGFDSWWDEYRIMDPWFGSTNWVCARRDFGIHPNARYQWVETIVMR